MKLLGTYNLNISVEEHIKKILLEKGLGDENTKRKEFIYGHCDDHVADGQKDISVTIETFSIEKEDNVEEVSFLTMNKVEAIYLYEI